MKKLILGATVFLAMQSAVIAQELNKERNAVLLEKVATEVVEVKNAIGLSIEKQQKLAELLFDKHNTIAEHKGMNVYDARKTILNENMEHKLRELLSEQELSELRKNEDLYKKITVYNF